MPRGQIRLNQLHLTKFRVKFPYNTSTRVVRKAWKENKVDEKWKESPWFRKVTNKQKVSLNCYILSSNIVSSRRCFDYLFLLFTSVN